MKCFERMEVYKKVPYSQAFEKDWANAHWNQVARRQDTRRHVPQQSDAAVGGIKNANSKVRRARTRRRNKKANPEEDSSTVITHVDVHQAYHTHTLCQKTYVDLPEEDQTGKSECVDIWSM